MKKLSLLFLLVSVFAFCGCDDDDDAKTFVLNLPNYETHTLDMGNLEQPDKAWSKEEWGATTDYRYNLLTDKSGIFTFDCYSTKQYGFYSDSFAFTNCTKTDCPNFAAYDYRAVTKKGVSNGTYVIVGASGYKVGENNDQDASIRFKDYNNKKEWKSYTVKGLWVTNCMFAYKSMKEGTSYAQKEDKFGKNDSFKLTVYNEDKTMKVECMLAEGTNILTEWKWIDLTSLGSTKGLKFTLTTTRKDEYGPLTPSYFCVDGITLVED